MSWIENVDKSMTIITGDGKRYEPLWIRSTVEKDYNVSQFDFIEVSGTLVRRYEPKGARYTLRICFQGDNHLDEVDAFMRSADDPRSWIILHPLYGTIRVQPIRLQRDDTSANVTEISGPFVETITEDGTAIEVSPASKVIADKASLDDLIADSYVGSLSPSGSVITELAPPTIVIQNQRARLTEMYNVVSTRVRGSINRAQDAIDATNYFNLYQQANAGMVTLTSLPLDAIRKVTAMVNAPFLFVNSVKSRVNLLVQSFNVLRANIEGISENAKDAFTRKKIYETNGSLVISSIASASVLQFDPNSNQLTETPPVVTESTLPVSSDYGSRQDVLDVTEQLLDVFNQFMSDLDSLQSENGGEENGYMPDFQVLIALQNLVEFTVSNLLDVVLDSRQERVIVLQDDTNVIELAHRFYGLDQQDRAIEQIISNNNMGISELLGVRKGRQIRYYV